MPNKESSLLYTTFPYSGSSHTISSDMQYKYSLTLQRTCVSYDDKDLGLGLTLTLERINRGYLLWKKLRHYIIVN